MTNIATKLWKLKTAEEYKINGKLYKAGGSVRSAHALNQKKQVVLTTPTLSLMSALNNKQTDKFVSIIKSTGGDIYAEFVNFVDKETYLINIVANAAGMYNVLHYNKNNNKYEEMPPQKVLDPEHSVLRRCWFLKILTSELQDEIEAIESIINGGFVSDEELGTVHDAWYYNHKNDMDIISSNLLAVSQLTESEDLMEKYFSQKSKSNLVWCSGKKKTVKKKAAKKDLFKNLELEGDWTDAEKDLIPNVPFSATEKIKMSALQLKNGTVSHLEYGPTGTGKSTNCKIICKLLGLPVKSVINCTNGLDQYILGKYVPKGTEFEFITSPIVDAVRNGGAVIFEEINFGDPRNLIFLNSLLDDRGFITLDNGEKVERHPNFRFFATMNPGYSGTCELNLALKRRFGSKYYVPQLPDENLAELLEKEGVSDKNMQKEMITLFHKIAQKIEEEGREERVSPRALRNWASEIRNGISFKTAAKNTILNVAKDDIPFRNFILDMISAISETQVGDTADDDGYAINRMNYTLTPDEIEDIMNLNDFAMSDELSSVARALSTGSVSFIQYGPTGTGKSTNCDILSRELGLPVKAVINCTNALDQYVLGKYVPQGEGFVFRESGFTDAIRNGGIVVLEEINGGNPKYLSFLNSLLDDNAFIDLDNGVKVKRHPDFRLFATMNPGYAGTCDMNPALYDRFEIGMFVEEPDLQTISDRLAVACPKLDNDDINAIVAVYSEIKKYIDDNYREEHISFADILEWAKFVENTEDLASAAEFTIVNIAMEDEEFRKYITKLI